MTPEPDSPVGLAVLGAGTIGTIHALASLETPAAQVRAVWSRTPSRADELAAHLGSPSYVELEAALAAPGVEAAVIATPTFLHEEYALAAARAGRHVICEKPLARELGAADAIIAACEEAGVRLLVAHVVRFFPDLAALHKAVVERRVGTPAVARISRAAPFPHGRDEWHSRLRVSGGAAFDMGIHDLDWLLWTFGPARRVYSRGLYLRDLPFLDYALTTVRHTSGVIAHVESSWAETGGFRVRAEVAGDGGLLAYDSHRSTPISVDLHEEPEVPPGVAVPTTHTAVSPYVAQLEHLARCIRGVEAPLVTPEAAYEALRLGLAALESIETGLPVELAEGGAA